MICPYCELRMLEIDQMKDEFFTRTIYTCVDCGFSDAEVTETELAIVTPNTETE